MLHTRPPHFLPLTWMFNSLAHSNLLLLDVVPVLCNHYVYITDEVVSIIRCAVHRCHLKKESPVFSTPLPVSTIHDYCSYFRASSASTYLSFSGDCMVLEHGSTESVATIKVASTKQGGFTV